MAIGTRGANDSIDAGTGLVSGGGVVASVDGTMAISYEEDRWLLPGRQYPSWDPVPEDRLHARREATFLLLAAGFLVTIATLAVFGTSRTIDPAPLVAAALPELALPVAMRIPFGVLPFAFGGLALTLVCELYGSRRAAALVATGLVAGLALAGFTWLADRLDGSDASFGPALGLASCVLVAYASYVSLFQAARRRLAGRHLWLRVVVLMTIAQVMGWATFGGVMYGQAQLLGSASHPDLATIRALATGSAVYTLACVVVSTLPTSLVARGLRRLLRVARDDDDYESCDDCIDYGRYDLRPPSYTLERRHLPAAYIVDNGVTETMIPPRRVARASNQPYSNAELQFFAEGDQLADPGTDA